MVMTRTHKSEVISTYENGLAQAPHAFLVNFQGLTVNQATELRNKVRESGGEYEVVKNTLALLAVRGRALEVVSDQFNGPTAVAYIQDDPVSLAKALTDFAKGVPAIEFKGGVIDGKAIQAAQVQDIAKMPSRDELIAKLLFLLQSPITRFVRGLAAIPQQLVVVLDQISKKQHEGNEG